VFAAIEDQVRDLGDFGFNDGVVIAQRCRALEHRSGLEFSKTGIELHADIRRDQGPEDGDILRAVYAKKYKHQRIAFAPSGDSATEQECDSADENSAHFKMK